MPNWNFHLAFHELLLLTLSLQFMVMSLQNKFKILDTQCCFHREWVGSGQRAITSSARNSILFVSFPLQAFVFLFEDVKNLLYDLLTYSWVVFLPVPFLSIQSA